MTATEKLRKLLDERGVEWWPSDERWNEDVITHWRVGAMQWTAIEGEKDLWLNAGIAGHEPLTPEQAVAATVGRVELTAEQVRDAIMSADRWKKPIGDTGMTNTHLIIRDDGWQAIADKLNATLGGGECVMEYGGNVAEGTARAMDVYFCSECGSPTYNDCMPYYCIYCGKAVKR